jgi:hypothetical protein
MRMLDAKLKASIWAVQIRDAQRQQAEAVAVKANKELQEAEALEKRAAHEVELASCEWDHMLTIGQSFDPIVAQLWAREIFAREEYFRESTNDAGNKATADVAAKTEWNRALVRADRAQIDKSTALRQVVRKRDEVHINDLADLATQRSLQQ